MSRTGLCCSVLLLLVSSCSKPQAATTSSMERPQANQMTSGDTRSPTDRAKNDVEALQGALTQFKDDTGRYPSASEGWDALLYRPSNVTKWYGPYIAQPAKDPWGNDYVYVYPGVHNPRDFDVYSLGPEGKDAKGNTANNWSSVH
jgi:type II secretion system protein G